MEQLLAARRETDGPAACRSMPMPAPPVRAMADGDGRYLLNLAEELFRLPARGRPSTPPASPRPCSSARRSTTRRRKGHYNLICALHKSLRGSDTDAALYWLARMLEGGEDPLYIARRLVRFAVEDIGMADPQALTQAIAAWDTYERLGLAGRRTRHRPASSSISARRRNRTPPTRAYKDAVRAAKGPAR